jgi:glutamate-ammonia-ligase adenylyltransferase
MTAAAGQIDADLIRSQLGSAYDHFSPAERARHVALATAIRSAEDVVLQAEERPGGRWQITICSADHVGSLSILAGLFAAYRMNIINADIFTIHVPREQPAGRAPVVPGRRRVRLQAPTAGPRRVVLDIFEVQALQGADAGLWDAFRQDLVEPFALLSAGRAEEARSAIIDRFSEAVRQFTEDHEPLYPVIVDIENSETEPQTRLTIRSTDTVGFLFEFTNALAMLNVNIDRAEVRTVAGETRDTLWVTDARGGKIVDSARIFEIRVAAAMIKQFTHLLPRSPDPGQALRQFSALIKQMLARPDWTEKVPDLESRTVLDMLAEMLGVSRFLWEDFLRMQHDNLFPVLLDAPALRDDRSPAALRDELARRLADATSFADRVRLLNEFK